MRAEAPTAYLSAVSGFPSFVFWRKNLIGIECIQYILARIDQKKTHRMGKQVAGPARQQRDRARRDAQRLM